MLTGLGLPSQMKKYVHNGTVKAFALWNPEDLGYLAGYAVSALAEGKITGKVGETFKAGKLGTYKIINGPDKRPQVDPRTAVHVQHQERRQVQVLGAMRRGRRVGAAPPLDPTIVTTTQPDPAALSRARRRRASAPFTRSRTATSSSIAGEVHGLVGENGAGKSTLVKILAGVHRPDAGRLLLDGEEAIFDNAKQSQAAGIAIIFQEPTLFPDLSVAENIFVGAQPLKRFRRIDGRRMRREAAAVFEQLGVRLDPDRLARGLSIADQQLVEIAKALTTNARVIVMDEPTAALTSTEVDRLFGIVETLRAHGNAVLFISHRLEEIFAICQRVTVMRDGRHVLTKPIEELTTQSIIRAMVGRDMDALFPKVPTEPGRVVLKVDRLTREGVFTDVSFDVRSGEIVALAGLVGAGRTRGRARDLRDRPLGRGLGRDRRQAAAAGVADRRDGRRRRARPRGPSPAGARDGLLDRAQHRARVARQRPAAAG